MTASAAQASAICASKTSSGLVAVPARSASTLAMVKGDTNASAAKISLRAKAAPCTSFLESRNVHVTKER